MAKNKRKMQAWNEARKRHHLSHAQVQMARELGMNPKKLGKLDNHDPARRLHHDLPSVRRHLAPRPTPSEVMTPSSRKARNTFRIVSRLVPGQSFSISEI